MKHPSFMVACFFGALLWIGIFFSPGCSQGPAVVTPVRVFLDSAAKDQDDLCLWINPYNPSKSTVITVDKKANAIFVYDLNARTIQTLPSERPGNIDIRQFVPNTFATRDLVVWNERSSGNIIFCTVDPSTATLSRLDNGTLQVPAAYGCCLYHSLTSKKVYVVTTSKSGRIDQYELHSTPTGTITGTKVRTLMLSSCEAAVADDEQKVLFIACEKDGIWKVGAEPHDRTPALAIDRVGHNGLRADIEGITIYREKSGGGYIIVSSQGNSRFNVYERMQPHRFIGSFRIQGVRFTDGIDATGSDCGGDFEKGFFACHNGDQKNRCPVVLVPWQAIEDALKLNTYRS